MSVYSRRLADLKGVLLFVQHPLEAGDGFDLYCVQAAFGGETNRAAAKKENSAETRCTGYREPRKKLTLHGGSLVYKGVHVTRVTRRNIRVKLSPHCWLPLPPRQHLTNQSTA